MAYYREPIDYNPGFPSRSSSPPQFPEYSLWGDSSNPSNFNKAPQRPVYPLRVADDGPRRYYHSADDRPKSSRIQGVERHVWPPFTPDREEQRMSFRNFPPQRSPNQFTEDQPMRMQPQLWHNVPQYDEHRFSVSPQRPDEYCGSPLQPTRHFSEDPQPLMSMCMQRPRFLFPTGRSNEYCRPMFQPSVQYSKDSHQFLIPAKRPQHQFASQRSDEHTRPPFPAYNGFLKFAEEPQSLIPQLSHPYRHSPLPRPDEHTRSQFPASDMHNSSKYYDEDSQIQSCRLRSPLQRPEHTRSPLPVPEMQNSFRNYDKDLMQPMMAQTRHCSFKSPVQRPDEHSRSQFQPSEQQYNSRDYTEDPSHATLLPKASQQQLNTQYAEDMPQVSIPPKKRILSPELGLELKLTRVVEPSNKMVPNKPPEDIEIDENPQPELIDLEEIEMEVVEIERKSLYLHPDNFQFQDEIDKLPEHQEQASTSSGSSGEWTSNIFRREGAPPSQCSLPSRVLPRGQKTNTLNKRLVKALSQPVKMEKGAKMMQRMGWIGGGLGKDGTGIVDPIAPNAVYATTTIGFGQEVKAIQRLPTKRENRTPCLKRNKSKKMHDNSFKANVLMILLKFATNDLQVELYFEALLKNSERKRIHRIVEAIGNEDSNMQFNQQLRIVEEIRRRCRFTLNTQSDGEGEQRKICVFKEAPEHMFLVTPDDCRPCLTDINVDEDEPNPFLRSIKKHIKEDPESLSPAPSYLIDILVELFLEFCEGKAYTEFRFLGPFKKEEIVVINCFLTLIEDLTHLTKPDYVVPKELLEAFARDIRFYTEMDPNGFTSIKKIHFSMKEEYTELLAEKRKKRLSLRHQRKHWPERFAWRTAELLSVDNLT